MKSLIITLFFWVKPWVYLVELDPRIYDVSGLVGTQVLAGDVIYEGFESPLIGDEVRVVPEVGEGGRGLGALQAGDARRLGELVVVPEVV